MPFALDGVKGLGSEAVPVMNISYLIGFSRKVVFCFPWQ